jgi:hypothetical protein
MNHMVTFVVVTAGVVLATWSISEAKCYEKRGTDCVSSAESSGWDSTCQFKCKIAVHFGKRTTMIFKKRRWQRAINE